MTKRRTDFDPFSVEQCRWPHRLHVRDELGNTLRDDLVPGGSDLYAVFDSELKKYVADGWAVEDSFKAMAFMRRGGQRHVLSLTRDQTYAGGPLEPPQSAWRIRG